MWHHEKGAAPNLKNSSGLGPPEYLFFKSIYSLIFIVMLVLTWAYPCTEHYGSDHRVTSQLCCQSWGLSLVSCLGILSLYLVLCFVWFRVCASCLCILSCFLSGSLSGLGTCQVWQAVRRLSGLRSGKLTGLGGCHVSDLGGS